MLILRWSSPSGHRLLLRDEDTCLLFLRPRLLAMGNPSCQREEQAMAHTELLRCGNKVVNK